MRGLTTMRQSTRMDGMQLNTTISGCDEGIWSVAPALFPGFAPLPLSPLYPPRGFSGGPPDGFYFEVSPILTVFVRHPRMGVGFMPSTGSVFDLAAGPDAWTGRLSRGRAKDPDCSMALMGFAGRDEVRATGSVKISAGQGKCLGCRCRSLTRMSRVEDFR